MEKTGSCRCGAFVRIPNSECLYECKNCHTKGVFLCHIIPNSADPSIVRCKECKIAYTMFECPQCQATGVIKEFRGGQVYGCLCGFTATFVSCSLCTAMLCLPPKGSYANTAISCKKCSNRFKYRVCSACNECNYMKPEQQLSQNIRCFNEKCIYYSKNQGWSNNAQHINFTKNQGYPQQKDSIKCRICRNNIASMMNSTCFHVSACETCVDQLSLNRCPVCSANGQFRRANVG